MLPQRVAHNSLTSGNCLLSCHLQTSHAGKGLCQSGRMSRELSHLTSAFDVSSV